MVDSIFSKVLDCQGTTLKIDSNNEGISRQISNSLENTCVRLLLEVAVNVRSYL